MDVSVSSRHIELSDALRAVAEEKIGRLDRFVEGMDRAEVHFFEEQNPRISATGTSRPRRSAASANSTKRSACTKACSPAARANRRCG